MIEETHCEQRTNREISNANLIPYKKGQSGNPEGRPKDIITSLIKELLEQEVKGGKTHAQLVAEAIVKLSEDSLFKGNVSAIKELLDRVEGKVPDTHKIESDVPINIIYKQVGDREE